MKQIKRENFFAMRKATFFASRGTGFYLAGIGAIFQSGKMFKAISTALPYTGNANIFFSVLGAIALGAGLLYFVSRSRGGLETEKGSAAEFAYKSVVFITKFEIFLGISFYLNTLVWQPLLDGVSFMALNHVGIIQAMVIAYVVPTLIKAYASQIRVMDRVEGENHKLSESERLGLVTELEKMFNEKLEIEYNKIQEIKDLYSSEIKQRAILEVDLKQRISELNQELNVLTIEHEKTLRIALEGSQKADEALLEVGLSDYAIESFNKGLETIEEMIGSTIENECLKAEGILIPEIREFSEKQNQISKQQLKKVVETAHKNMRELAKTLLVSTREKILADIKSKVQSESGEFLDLDAIETLVNKTISDKVKTFDLGGHTVGGLKKSITSVKNKVEQLQMESVKKGSKFEVDTGGKKLIITLPK